ncbi:hypothetical protein [Bacillus phage vB_BanS-Thrax3]|nr:hypothetical protein [Bacillus phage vB_BanS-Thrax1]UUV46546.1 hypothetical protein [Bacillus phage vB_BanS-Thrax3]
MKAVQGQKHTTLYPNVEKHRERAFAHKNATVLTPKKKNVIMLNRAYKEGWHTVQFIMKKEEFQEYINELQKVCDSLEQ